MWIILNSVGNHLLTLARIESEFQKLNSALGALCPGIIQIPSWCFYQWIGQLVVLISSITLKEVLGGSGVTTTEAAWSRQGWSWDEIPSPWKFILNFLSLSSSKIISLLLVGAWIESRVCWGLLSAPMAASALWESLK